MNPFRLLAAALALGAAFGAHAAALELEVQGVTQAGGIVYAALYQHAEDFPRAERALTGVMAVAAAPVTRLTFASVAPGEYAVAVYHDLNGNGRLDRNMFGVPTEPYGFSRDAVGNFGPAKFADSAFRIDAEPVTLKIQLR
jgi:uncharacterized protein (DUF2141 family)